MGSDEGQTTTRQPAVDDVFESTERGELRLIYSHCEQCGAEAFPFRSICTACQSGSTQRRTAAHGEIFAFTYVHEAFGRGSLPVPYGIARVQLQGGPIVRGLLHPEFSDPHIGNSVGITEIPLETEGEVEFTTFAFQPLDK